MLLFKELKKYEELYKDIVTERLGCLTIFFTYQH
jgi:hypothetical protein